jgi:hypothetical protein
LKIDNVGQSAGEVFACDLPVLGNSLTRITLEFQCASAAEIRARFKFSIEKFIPLSAF